MVKIALQITCRLENVEEVKPSGSDFRWCLKFVCFYCGEISSEWNYVSLDESTPVQGGNDVNHFVYNCRLCSRKNSIAIIEDSITSFTADDQGQFKTIVIFDCRGLELCDYSAREGWKAQAVKNGTEFISVDLSKGNWVDYCHKLMEIVAICEIQHKFLKIN